MTHISESFVCNIYQIDPRQITLTKTVSDNTKSNIEMIVAPLPLSFPPSVTQAHEAFYIINRPNCVKIYNGT